jgi:anti-anti-sigma factor
VEQVNLSGTDVARLAIDGALSIYNAVDSMGRLNEALASAAALDLDLSGVDDLDTAGLQLLLWLKREGQRTGKPVRIVGHSPAVRTVIDFCGLAGYFGDPMVIAAGEGTWTN